MRALGTSLGTAGNAPSALAIVALALLLAAVAPGFFARDNLADLFLANVPVLIIALGMTLIVLTGHIDISVGSMFACCAVASGVLAKAGVPMPLVLVGVVRPRRGLRRSSTARSSPASASRRSSSRWRR